MQFLVGWLAADNVRCSGDGMMADAESSCLSSAARICGRKTGWNFSMIPEEESEIIKHPFSKRFLCIQLAAKSFLSSPQCNSLYTSFFYFILHTPPTNTNFSVTGFPSSCDKFVPTFLQVLRIREHPISLNVEYTH